MPSISTKIDDRADVIAEAYRGCLVDTRLTQSERVVKLANLRGRIEGLLIARCDVTGQTAGSETVEAKADELLGVERAPEAVGLIR